MKLLFIMLTATINFAIYCTPAFLLNHVLKKWFHGYQPFTELKNKAGILLASLPFFIWFVLFLFDPTQKTVQQMIFLDPLLIGLLVTVLLLMQEKFTDQHVKNKMNIAFTVFAMFFSVFCFFLLDTAISF